MELNHSKEFYRLLNSSGFDNDEIGTRLKYYRNIFVLADSGEGQ